MLTPEEFAQIADQVQFREELQVVAAPAPKKLAPYGISLLGEIDSNRYFADSRIVILYNPEGDPAWNSSVRIIIFIKADIEAELADDPLILQIGWQWLQESLANSGASAMEISGTVTRTSAKGFGAIDEESPSTIEIRASWSPTEISQLEKHIEAWGNLVCTAAGLDPEGITSIR